MFYFSRKKFCEIKRYSLTRRTVPIPRRSLWPARWPIAKPRRLHPAETSPAIKHKPVAATQATLPPLTIPLSIASSIGRIPGVGRNAKPSIKYNVGV